VRLSTCNHSSSLSHTLSIPNTDFLLKLGLAGRCLRTLIELQEQETGAALATAEAILHCLDIRKAQQIATR
jgi:hypothetical protein